MYVNCVRELYYKCAKSQIWFKRGTWEIYIGNYSKYTRQEWWNENLTKHPEWKSDIFQRYCHYQSGPSVRYPVIYDLVYCSCAAHRLAIFSIIKLIFQVKCRNWSLLYFTTLSTVDYSRPWNRNRQWASVILLLPVHSVKCIWGI